MIASLSGILRARGADHAIVEVAGVGYRLGMSTSGLARLGALGDDVFVHTHLLVRENDLTLVGFADVAERDVFLRLLDVSGIGPKAALAILSTLTPAALAIAIATEDVALVSTAPGVGKKTAQRIIIELKDRLSSLGGLSADGPLTAGGAPGISPAEGGSSEAGSAAPLAAPSALADARMALQSMGFTPAEVAASLAGAPATTESSAEALISYALRQLGGRG